MGKIVNHIHEIVKNNYNGMILTFLVFNILDVMLTYVGVFIYGLREGNKIIKVFFDNEMIIEFIFLKFLIIIMMLIIINYTNKYKEDNKVVSITFFVLFYMLLVVLIDWIIAILWEIIFK